MTDRTRAVTEAESKGDNPDVASGDKPHAVPRSPRGQGTGRCKECGHAVKSHDEHGHCAACGRAKDVEDKPLKVQEAQKSARWGERSGERVIVARTGRLATEQEVLHRATIAFMREREYERLEESAPPLPHTDTNPRSNWVEKSGGLPRYIDRIARHLHEKGKPVGMSIAIAVNVVKKMCATGDVNFPGVQQVNAKSRAEACAAVAEWEKKKAASHVGKK